MTNGIPKGAGELLARHSHRAEVRAHRGDPIAQLRALCEMTSVDKADQAQAVRILEREHPELPPWRPEPSGVTFRKPLPPEDIFDV